MATDVHEILEERLNLAAHRRRTRRGAGATPGDSSVADEDTLSIARSSIGGASFSTSASMAMDTGLYHQQGIEDEALSLSILKTGSRILEIHRQRYESDRNTLPSGSLFAGLGYIDRFKQPKEVLRIRKEKARAGKPFLPMFRSSAWREVDLIDEEYLQKISLENLSEAEKVDEDYLSFIDGYVNIHCLYRVCMVIK
jgi:hypothetical protein